MKKFIYVLLSLVVAVGCARTISDLILKVGDGTDVDVEIEAELGKGASNPSLKYNATDDAWEFCNEGAACAQMGSGGGGGGTYIQEVPSGLINNVNQTYTLSQTPVSSASVKFYVNGVLQKQGTDYTVSILAKTITIVGVAGQEALQPGTQIYATYIY